MRSTESNVIKNLYRWLQKALCNLAKLGDISQTHERVVQINYKKQLKQSEEGCYESGLMAKQSNL